MTNNMWKISIAFHTKDHTEVYRLEFPPCMYVGTETLGELVFEDMKAQCVQLGWQEPLGKRLERRGFGLLGR